MSRVYGPTPTSAFRSKFRTGLLLACLAFSPTLLVRAQPVSSRFKVPELDAQGNLKSMLMGEQARMAPGKPVEIKGLNIEFYGADKTVKMRVTSPECVFNDRTGQATSTQAVKIEGDAYTITGTGFDYHTKEETLAIHADAKVVLRNLGPSATPTPPPASQTAAPPTP
jgi:hypothetical protein